MERLSVLIPTYNNERIIRGCLESVKWADEIVVCDSFSTDRTLDVCREYTDRILQHEYVNSAKQKNWAIPHCSNEWVLIVDTDERLEPGLVEEIRAFLADPPVDVNACRIARKNIILGEWVRVANLWPDYVTRLFRKSACKYEDKEVHADIRMSGRTHVFAGAFLHHGSYSLSKQLQQLDRYTTYQADEFEKRGIKFSWWRILTRPVGAFFYYYFYRGGITAGYRGLLVSVHPAVYSFFTYSKLWERQRKKETLSILSGEPASRRSPIEG